MSNKIVRTLSQPSNRANQRDGKEKKVVFKGVVDSPFRILWPSVPLNLQNALLTYIAEKLEGASDHHFSRCSLGRKRKRTAKVLEDSLKRKQAKVDSEVPEDPEDGRNLPSVPNPSQVAVPNTQFPVNIDQADSSKFHEPPLMLRHMIYGINEVTKRLETQTQNARHVAIVDGSEPPTLMKYVFVCRADVDPPLLIDHLPHLVAAYNSTCLRNPIKLVALPQGAELLLAQKLGIRRVTVMTIDNEYEDQQLTSMLEQVPTLTASWLSQTKTTTMPLIATHIKHVRTTAPRDMKAAKDLRVQQKSEAKKKKTLLKKAGRKG